MWYILRKTKGKSPLTKIRKNDRIARMAKKERRWIT